VDAQDRPVEIAHILKFQDDQQFDRYARNSKADTGSHKKKIFDVVFCEELGNGASKLHTQRVIHSEHGSNMVGIYSTDMKPIAKIIVPVKVEKTNVMSLCFRDMSTESSNFGPVGTSSLIAISTADSHIHIYAQIKDRLEYWKAVPTDGIQDKIWCLKHSKHFITAGMKDFQIRQWNFSPFVKNPLVGEPISIHTDSVTDILEIRNPPSIITCSLDKTIKMYNLDRRTLIRSFTQHHKNGIKQLTYIPGFNRLISRGYEVYVNIWNPENLYGEPFIASLRGHTKPVVSMDDIKGQPYVVTMDQEGEIIIWDVRTMFQMQTVPARANISMAAHGVFCFTKSKLWLYGTRFYEFDKEYSVEKKDEQQLAEEKEPINAFYNEFFNMICVLCGNQLKLFNAEEGRLTVLHQNLFKLPNSTAHCIDQDKRHRKVYAASSQG
jgi:hypothetical protein